MHNFIYRTQSVDDDLVTQTVRYHGSKAAAIIGAQGNNGLYLTGVAWDTSLMILKVVASDDRSDTRAVADAIMYAANNGATAINLSLGFRNATCTPDERGGYVCTEGPYDQTLEGALHYARDRNMVTVCAAGNGAAFGDRLPDGTHPIDNDLNINRISPGSIPTDNNISVLATNRADNEASYSSHGKYRVDLGAPGGEAVIGVQPADLIPGLIQTYTVPPSSSDVEGFYGTSAAAPHVTGALALVKSMYGWEDYAGIRDRVLMGTERTGMLEGKCRTNGRLDLFKALQPRSLLLNLSTRARVGGGEQAMIGGFYVKGAGTLKVIIRALGPSLPNFSVPKLNNPTLRLTTSAGQPIFSNDDWGNLPQDQKDTLINLGFAPADSREAAIVWTLPAGGYTAIVETQDGQSGIGLFEIYALGDEQTRLVNLSTRCFVGTGDEVAVAGTIIDQSIQTSSKPNRRLLMFGKGPSLAAFGLQGLLGDPQIRVSDTGEFNDQWRTIDDDSGDGNALEEKLDQAGLSPTNGFESALWPTFGTGGHTVELSGANQSTGIGLIEFYEY